MKKSRFISFCGWAFLFLEGFAWGDALIYGFTSPHWAPFPRVFAAAALLLSIPCFLVWALGSIVHRFRVGGAKMRAQAMVEALQKAGVGPLAAPHSAGKPTSVSTGLLVCGVCNRAPALVRCVEHSLLLCQSCWHEHNSQQHGGAPPLVQTGTG
jgi:hypothetical protein